MPDVDSTGPAVDGSLGAAQWLAGGGELGALMRALDWNATPLGPPDDWPQSLRSAVSILLPSKAQICLFWGPDLVALYNDAYRPALGIKHPWALGRPAREMWSEIWDDVLRPLLEGVLTTGEALRASNYPFALERHGYPEETYFDISYDPIRDETGKVGGIFCIVSETTGRVVGERRLRVLRDLGRAAADARRVDEVFAKAACVLELDAFDFPFAALLDDDGAQMAGCRTTGPQAWPIGQARAGEMVLTGEDLERSGPLSGGAWPEPSHTALMLPIATPGQPPCGYLVAGISPRLPLDDLYRDFLRLVASGIAAGVAAARALEEQRAQAQALAELDRAKTAFFSNVSHEFRTPLTLMLGPIEEELREHPASAPRLELARRSSLRLLKLVNTLLDFSRIEAGRISASYEPVDLAALTGELASIFRSAVERAGLRLVADCAPLPEPVYVDREMWEKIVLNLLSNAFKFTFDGEIAVRLDWGGDRVTLTVRDTGVGIAASEVPKVFDRFYRVPHVRARTHEGTGIGLALVRELARLHGGDVSVQSREGEGSVFVVTVRTGTGHLPADRVAAPREVASTAVAASAFVEEALRWLPDAGASGADTDAMTRSPGVLFSGPEEAADHAQARVLLVDDNADMREYVRGLLSRGYVVTTCSDGQEALETLGADPVDLVVADVMMPRLDGFELLAAIRGDDRLSGLPVILLSARAGEEARMQGLAAGADAYLVKPFSARELLVTVASQLQLARLRHEHERTAMRLMAELQDADRRKDEFLALLAHELRNPLAPLRTGVEILQRSLAGDPAQLQIVEAMGRQVDQMVRLIDDLLNVSRISRGQIDLQTAPVDLGAIVMQAVETARPELERANVELTLTLPRGPVVIEADATRLVQAAGNLLNNAAKFTPPGGQVWVTAERAGREAVIRVRDTGIGIDPSQLTRVFEMFVQIDTSLERKRGGLGLGLTIVKTLVEQHGGRVRAGSAGPGRGAEFVIHLPLPPAAVELSAADASGPSPAPTTAPRRVLIVEDNCDSAEMLATFLTMEGHQVQMAHDGRHGVEAFHSFRPDIVLLDIGLPEINGYEAARRIRALPTGRSIALVALTGWGQDADRRRSAEVGFDAHLVKPVDPAVLAKMIEELTAAVE
jgi:signal transduction histidine kinase